MSNPPQRKPLAFIRTPTVTQTLPQMTPAFAHSAFVPRLAPSNTTAAVCSSSTPRHAAVRMEQAPPAAAPATASAATVETPAAVTASWPPSEMTEEWAAAIDRLVTAVSTASRLEADEALDKADGDEVEALRLLTDDSWTPIRAEREAAVAAARAAGDVGRVSALKEAELRRKATGSARDFFKGYIEIEGQYVDSGYVDESADTMGKIADTFKAWFGKGKQ